MQWNFGDSQTRAIRTVQQVPGTLYYPVCSSVSGSGLWSATGWLSIPSTNGARTSPISVLIRGKTSGSRAVKAVPCILVRFARTSHKSKPACDVWSAPHQRDPLCGRRAQSARRGPLDPPPSTITGSEYVEPGAGEARGSAELRCMCRVTCICVCFACSILHVLCIVGIAWFMLAMFLVFYFSVCLFRT